MVKIPSTPKKLLQKVFQLILVGFNALFYQKKVYQSLTLGKVFFSRWRPKWPPKPSNGHNFMTTNSNLMILVSIPRFWRATNTMKQLRISSSCLINMIFDIYLHLSTE